MESLPTLYEYYTSGGISAGLSAENPYFTLNEKNFTIYSGAMHYFRVPPEYWRDRLRRMKAAGLNTVETYVPWNLHEPSPGEFDFGAGGSDWQEFLNVEKFLKTAQEEDLLAIVRPGPYICAEFEFGGLPSWLMRNNGIRVRTSDEVYVNFVERFFKALFTILATLQFTKGGPIIMFQVENEYGSTGNSDSEYLESLKKIMEDNGLVELFVTSGAASQGTFGGIPGVLQAANFQGNAKGNLDTLKEFQPDKPLLTMEYWTGWFDHWTEQHHTTSLELFNEDVEEILKYPASINLYMFLGGTTFGFMNGANIADSSSDNSAQQPDTTSYDYDAPLTETGDYTNKYRLVKNLLDKYSYVKIKLPDMPDTIEKVAYDEISVTGQLSLDALVAQSQIIQSEYLKSMEELDINNGGGQSYGYIVYRKENIDISADSVLKIEGHVCDTVVVLINGELKSGILEKASDLDGFGYWRLKDSTLSLGSSNYEGATLDLVVENFGRSNFGGLSQFHQPKGLPQGNVTINDEVLTDWSIVPLEFKKSWSENLMNFQTPTFDVGPNLYRAILNVNEPKDTFIDMRDWNHGITIVNGFVLSRHFKLGPQQTEYLPAPFLNPGENEILIFEHFEPSRTVKFSNIPLYETH